MNRLLVSAAAILCGAFALVWLLAKPAGEPDRPASPVPFGALEGPGVPPQPVEEQRVVVMRNAAGQFHLTAQVNGEDVDFLVDTGADVVALTADTAELLGLDMDREGFEPIGRTASGVTDAKRVKLGRVELAGRQFRDVDAVIADDLPTNLLGQSLLRRLGSVQLSGDRLTIRLSP